MIERKSVQGGEKVLSWERTWHVGDTAVWLEWQDEGTMVQDEAERSARGPKSRAKNISSILITVGSHWQSVKLVSGMI